MDAFKNLAQILVLLDVITKKSLPSWDSEAYFAERMNRVYVLHDLPKRRSTLKD